MSAVRFRGRVSPPAVQVAIHGLPKVHWEAPERGLIMDFSFDIQGSEIQVACESNKFEPEDFVHVYMRALDLARASVDLVAFSMGYGLSVVLDTFVDTNGITSTILPQDPNLPALCTSFSLENGYSDVMTVVLQEPPLFRAINDLIVAITLPHHSSVNCARAVETIKHLLAPKGAKESQAWETMRTVLHVDEAYLKMITDNSKDVRHGKPVHVPGSVTSEITRRAWTIMDRFLTYRKRVNKPLPLSEFPYLKG
jgi:hypothetical protein